MQQELTADVHFILTGIQVASDPTTTEAPTTTIAATDPSLPGGDCEEGLVGPDCGIELSVDTCLDAACKFKIASQFDGEDRVYVRIRAEIRAGGWAGIVLNPKFDLMSSGDAWVVGILIIVCLNDYILDYIV